MTEVKYIHTTEIHNTSAAEFIVPYVVDLLSPKSIIDIGCGTGTWLKVFMDQGITDVTGVDGTYLKKEQLVIPEEKFRPHDLEKPLISDRTFDLVVCLEVAEHLPQSSAKTFVNTLTSHGDCILFSAAIKDQGGQNHLNEQPPSYWEKLFTDKGYKFYDLIRPVFWQNDKIEWWYRQNMFLVAKKSVVFDIDKIIDNDNLYIHPELFYNKMNDYKYLSAEYNKLRMGKASPITYLKLFLKSLVKGA